MAQDSLKGDVLWSQDFRDFRHDFWATLPRGTTTFENMYPSNLGAKSKRSRATYDIRASEVVKSEDSKQDVVYKSEDSKREGFTKVRIPSKRSQKKQGFQAIEVHK